MAIVRPVFYLLARDKKDGSMPLPEKTDVIVIGAALNGLAAALALGAGQARPALSVVILDRGDPGAFATAQADGRASAITASSRLMFEALGVWDAMAPHAEPMREIIVTDAQGAEARPTLLHFGADAHPGGASAVMIENRHLHAALMEKVRQSPAITLHGGVQVSGYSFGPGLATVTTSASERVKASLIVAADGRNSAARAAAGIKTYGWEYDQAGIVTTVAHELPHEGRAEEHFRPAGPFAILPLLGNRSSIVWTESRDEAARIVALDDDAFTAELRERFGTHLGAVTLAGPRHAYPLSMFIAQSFAGPRLALIGDAAHVVHPIAGLGFNLGLRDAAALAECVTNAVRLGLDPGNAAALEEYVRWRRFDTVATAVATDGLNRLFSNDHPALRVLRDAGLRIADRMGVVKSFFMREAAGETGRLPKLLQGEPV
ncbi:ubiquinone biosynthesis hydroxylase [soil metagenome]